MSGAIPCSKCKQPLPEGSRFCAACGHNSFDPIAHIQEGAASKAREERKDSIKEWLFGLVKGWFE